jgi:hypothetical protein
VRGKSTQVLIRANKFPKDSVVLSSALGVPPDRRKNALSRGELAHFNTRSMKSLMVESGIYAINFRLNFTIAEVRCQGKSWAHLCPLEKGSPAISNV